eukprot:Gb_16778 [translate_table: standard]
MDSHSHSHVGITVPQQRRPINVNPLPPFQPNNANLQFMSFDLGTSSSYIPPPGYAGAAFGTFEEEAPLLEELGINTNLILKKTLTILNPIRVNPDLHEDADLSGPFVFSMMLGLCQLLAGKLQFGVILGWICVASFFLYVVFNMLAGRHGNLDLYRCLSLVGYCMLPMVIFSAVSLFIPHRGIGTLAMAGLTVLWCTRACTSLLVVLAPHADEHRSLVAYACCLIYILFSLLVVF